MPARRIAGYAATFGDPDAQADVIDPGAFAQSLRRRRHRLPLLWQHTMTEPLGRVLAAREDGHGLWFEAAMAATRRAADATALLRQGALRECSIGFVPRQVRFEARNGATVRHIQQLDLIEISLVTLAANPAARILHIDGHPPGTGPPHSLSAARRRLHLAVPA